MVEDRTVWLYAVARKDPLSGRPPSVSGVGGEQPRVVAAEDLAAVVGDVAAEEFGAQALTRNLENLDWLARVARAHNAVVSAAGAAGAVVPVRLATLFANDEAVQDMLVRRRADFDTALETITGRAEWGVKAYADPQGLSRRLAESDERTGRHARAAPTASGGAGSAYLARRRAELATKQTAESMATAWTEKLHSRLCGLSAASRLHRAQDPQLSGRGERMVLNASYLVDEERTEDFRHLVDELAGGHEGLEVELTGPWPAYSFTASSGRVRDE